MASRLALALALCAGLFFGLAGWLQAEPEAAVILPPLMAAGELPAPSPVSPPDPFTEYPQPPAGLTPARKATETRFLEDTGFLDYAGLTPEVPLVRVAAGLREWLSGGRSSLSVAGWQGTPPVVSELLWKHLNNPIQEFWVDTLWLNRWVVLAEFGVGTAGSASLRDRDFNDDQTLASETQHPANDNQLFYFNLDLGYRFFCWEAGRTGWFTLDGLLGYQHWQENYVAHDGVDVFPGGRVFAPGPIISNRFAWDSFRIGLRARLEFACWSLQSRLFALPFTSFQNVDIHYQRTDLLQDPSFVDRASGGGVMADLTIAYRLWGGLQVEGGYRIWDITTGPGQSVTRTPTGDLLSPLHNATTLRCGWLLGLTYQF